MEFGSLQTTPYITRNHYINRHLTGAQPAFSRSPPRLSKNGKFMIVEMNGQNAILNANLVRYLFDIPYTRKNGVQISKSQIFEMKEKAQAAYDAKVRESAS